MFGPKMCKEGHIMDPSWKKCPVCLAPICGWLVVMSGDNKNEVFTLHEGKWKIGTGLDCDIRIVKEGISRHHILFVAKEGKYSVSDLNSMYGTYVNNIQISNKEIVDGDYIRLGNTEFKFKCL